MLRLLLKQIMILMWKYWVVRLKHWSTTIFELFGPLFLALLVAYLYSNSDYNKDDQKWKGPVFNKEPAMNMELSSQRVNFTQYLHYAPNNSQTFDIMERIRAFHPGNYTALFADPIGTLQTGGIFVQAHDNEMALGIELRRLIGENITYTPFVSGIAFDKSIRPNMSLPLHLKYSILTNGFRPTHVNKYFGRKLTAGPDFGVEAYPNMFCKIQSLVNEAFLSKLTEQYNKNRTKTASVNAFKYPYPKYRDNGDEFFQISIQELIGGTIVLGYIVTCPLIVKRITDEKAIKAKELLRMIGMSDWVFWTSHFLSFFTIMFAHNICFLLIYYIGFGGEAIYQYMDPSVFFVILTLYDIQNILYCMLITTVFNEPIIAVVVTVVLYLSTFSIPIGLTHPALHVNMDIGATNYIRLLSCILPNLGIVWSLAIGGQYEIHSLKLGWGQIFNEKSVYGELSVGVTLLAMLASTIIYGFLIWYVDAVWPFQYGVPKKIYFPCQPSYYCPKEKVRKASSGIEAVNFEAEPKGFKAVIKIKNLLKMFGSCGNTKNAVDNVSLNIFKGQIFALLGHNGAGKSTIMNMITGIYPPTEGSIMINGYSVITNTNKARKSIGLCPQENIIYEELTVRQHLKLYATLKDFPTKSIEAEVKEVINQLRLTNKTNELAIELSGGMKRRLQLGIALVGGTKVLVLDEPTSGLDPEARRCIWDVLQNMRQNKTIVLTTHYMEEADAIADRIAIMSAGRVKCCGSPMFLKKRFGGGYHLRIAKAKGFDRQKVETILRQFLPEAEMEMDIGTEVVFSLQRKPDFDNPKRESIDNQTKVLPDLFTRLEREKKELNIDTYGVSLTSLEEVFINVLSEETKENPNKIKFQVHRNFREKGWKLFRKQIYGLFMKRIHFAKRFWPMLIFQVALPSVLFMVILIVDYQMRNIFINFAKNLTLDLKGLYGDSYGFFNAKDEEWMPFGRNYYSRVARLHGMNVTILGPNQDPNKWAISHSSPVETYVRKYILGAAFDSNENKEILIESWYSNEAIHSLPMSLNIIYESLIKYFIPEVMSDKSQTLKITVENKPIGMSEDMLTFASVIFSYAVSCLLLTPITVPFLGASFVLFPIQERITKAKLLQLMTGLSPLTFWLCNFFFDLFTHIFAVVTIFIVFFLFDYNLTFFGQWNTAFGLILMLLFFGVASIPAAYCFSFVFKKSSTGYAILVMIYLFFGLILNLIMSFFDIYINVREQQIVPEWLYHSLLAILRFFPVFSMCFGIQKLYRTGAFAQQCARWQGRQEWSLICLSTHNSTDFFWGCCKEKCEANDECYQSQSPFRFNSFGIAPEFIYLLVDGIAFIFILWLIEVNFFKICNRKGLGDKKEKSIKDSDVAEEEQRIDAMKAKKNFSTDALVVYKLTKHFKNMTAVDSLTFGVHKEECFGLLGVNGAGKTTTFSMLTGDMNPSDGNAYIGEYELMINLKEFSQQIGFCPQFDPLLDRLTAKEMLYLFARLRGVRSSLIKQEVRNLIQMVDLEKYANRITQNYSGGNKRKLSLAMAIIGNPPVIFLDEPTAGVDPFARRKIWSTLDIVSKTYKSAFILTSHSMEESEALCGRIAIMVGGRLTCLGSTQHLRSKFGQGFTLDIKLKQELLKDPHYKKNIQKYMQKKFETAELKDSHQLVLHYHITDAKTKWSYIFDVMETAKRKLHLEDYTVSDTSLEQIFLSFALTQYKTKK